MLQVIETSKIFWISDGGKSTPLSEMHDDHLLRAAAWCASRLQMAQAILDKLHPTLHGGAISHNGTKLADWVEILTATANARATEKAQKQKAIRLTELEAELERLDPASKIARLKAEIETM